MSRERPQRVAELVQQKVAELMIRGFKDPRIGFATITGVKMSPDLKQAIVYYSVIGEEASKSETAKGLKAAAGYIKREISRDLKLRHTPDLRFVFDEAIEKGDRIERLLREVKVEDERREKKSVSDASDGGSALAEPTLLPDPLSRGKRSRS